MIMTRTETIMQFLRNGIALAQSMVQQADGPKAKGQQAKAVPATLGAVHGPADLSEREPFAPTVVPRFRYKLEVEATQHGSGVGASPAIYHWRVVDADTGMIFDHGRARTQKKAYRKGNESLMRFIG